MLDVDTNFEVSIATLLEDFEWFNEQDKRAIQAYEDELQAQLLIQQEFKEFLSDAPQLKPYIHLATGREAYFIEGKTIQLVRRPYRYPFDETKKFPVRVPDFKAMRAEYHASTDYHLRRTMMWAVAYSRLGDAAKTKLLAKYYESDLFLSAIKIANRISSTAFAKWLITFEG
jgi:hypothetical protein